MNISAADPDLEKALHVFSWGVVLHRRIRVLPHHVIDGPHDIQHLLKCESMKDLSQRTDGHPSIHFFLVELKCGLFIEFDLVHSSVLSHLLFPGVVVRLPLW